jgi:hypothetical protein
MSNDPPKNADPRLRPAQGRSGLTTLLVAGALSALVFGSRVVLQEIQSTPDMMGYDTIRRVGMIWDEAMHYVHATQIDAKLHGETRKVEQERF